MYPTDRIERELARAKRPCVTTGFQADGVVLLHMVTRLRPDIPVLFVDTLHHFDETLEYRDRLVREWRLNLITVRAEDPAPGLWRMDVDACCARHKVEPLFRALEGHDVWFSGLRRGQSPTRADLAAVAPFVLPSGTTLRKVSPLVDWTAEEVATYAAVHEVPILPLYDRGYTSIGCAPCTTPPTDPANIRSGRWQGRKLECGIHTSFGTSLPVVQPSV